jgi:hypothetical protein
MKMRGLPGVREYLDVNLIPINDIPFKNETVGVLLVVVRVRAPCF